MFSEYNSPERYLYIWTHGLCCLSRVKVPFFFLKIYYVFFFLKRLKVFDSVKGLDTTRNWKRDHERDLYRLVEINDIHRVLLIWNIVKMVLLEYVLDLCRCTYVKKLNYEGFNCIESKCMYKSRFIINCDKFNVIRYNFVAKSIYGSRLFFFKRVVVN